MTRLQANLLMTLAALFWGSTFVIQKMAMGDLAEGGEGIGPLTFTGLRFLLGVLVVLPLAWRQFTTVQLSRKDWAGIGLVGLLITAGILCQQYGLLYTTVTNAGFLTALYVPLTPIILLLVMRRKPHWSIWPAATGCLGGTWLLSGANNIDLNPGDMLVIAGAFAWAFHVIWVGIMAQRTGAALVIACAQFFICAVLCLIFAVPLESPSVEVIQDGWWKIVYGGLLSVGLGFTLQVVAQKYTPPADAAIILSSETLFAALAAAIVLNETLPAAGYVGCIIIFACVLSVELLPVLRKNKTKTPADTSRA